jgi:predicted phage terminase large subunit-like protein
LLRRRSVRQSLTEFARSEGFEPAAHHRLLIRELEALERGEFDFLLVEMPPGSAKSTYVNWLFPAWYLCRNPGCNVLSASHSSELAERWGRRTRNLVSTASLVLGLGLSADSTAAYRWGTTNGCEYYAVGVGVGIMGFRADLGIIDDPFGSREDAESRKVREARWEWYLNDFCSRLKPGARRVIMHQRFHEEDLAGRLVKHMEAIGRPVRRLKIRAEATEDDELGREPGNMLWDDPKGYDYGRFLRDRKAELAGDPRTWSALYQQEPIPETGAFFDRDWIKTYVTEPPRETLYVYGASDYAVTADGGDYTVHVVVGLDPEGRLYLLDLWRGQKSSDVWIEAFCDLVIKWKPLEWAEETGQIKAGLGPFIDRRQRDRRAYVVRTAFPTRGDKAVRAQSIRGRMALAGLYVQQNAPWLNELSAELLSFPAGAHDDQVDALGLAGQLLDKMIEGVAPKKGDDLKRDAYRPQRQPSENSALTI